MTRVVERCATCGVEHEARVDECEACGGALRYWCRAHSSEVGWLESAECRRCVEEKARPKPPRRPVVSPRAAPPPPVRGHARVPRTDAPARPVPPPVRRPAERPAGATRDAAPPRKHFPGKPGGRSVAISVTVVWVICVALFSVLNMLTGFNSDRGLLELALRGAATGMLVGLVMAVVIPLAWLDG